MSDNLLQIDILGASFVVQTDEGSVYLEKVVANFKERIKAVQLGMSTQDPLQIAILTGILITDELIKCSPESTGQESEEIAKLTARIIERIDKSLYNDIEHL